MGFETEQMRIRRHAGNGVILDSNLLIIFLVGLHDQNEVERFLPTVKGKLVVFPQDFGILKDLINRYCVKKFIVTPQILAEVSNLTFEHFKEPKLQQYIKRALAFIKIAEEKVQPKDDLLKTYHLPIVGFSDSSIIETAKQEKCLVLTEDLKCYALLEREKCCVYNMNHLRSRII